MCVVCTKVGLGTASLHYLADITSHEVPRDVKKLLQFADIKAVFVSVTVCQKVGTMYE